MEKEKGEELFSMCKCDYLKPTDDPRKMIFPFCATTQLHPTPKDIEDARPNSPDKQERLLYRYMDMTGAKLDAPDV